jgi:DNA-binding GntR family transcriptional regulator
MRQVVRRPFSDVVTARIRRAILDGALAPGSRVRQEELADRLGVSRAPIREALVVLEREGFVKTERWRGAVVTKLDAEFIAEIYDVRSAIDAYVASILAARREFDPTPFHAIASEGRMAVGTGDLLRLINIDSRFHIGLYKAVGNRVLVDVMQTQWRHIRRAMAATLSTSGYPKQAWKEHRAIVEAIARGQAKRASHLAHAHTANARTILVDSLTQSALRARTAEGSSPRSRRTRRKPPQKAEDFEPINPAVKAL